jgi:hypothetical protein
MLAREMRLALVLTCALVVALGGASARAAITHEYLSQITEVPAGSGAPFTGPFLANGIGGLAVDGSDLYLADGGNSGSEYRIDRFDASSGAFVSQFPQAPSSFAFLNQGIAVGHATGETEVYVAGDESIPGQEHGAVAVFDAAGNLQGVPWGGVDTPSATFGCFACSGTGDVAVDNSSALGDWASGDVYVADPQNAVVDVFKPLAKGGEEYRTQLTGISPSEPFITPYKVAVSSFNGDILIADQRENSPTLSTVVDVFKPGPLENEYEYVGELIGPASPYEIVTGIAVDNSDGDIYVAGTSGVDQFSASGVFLGRITGVGTPSGVFGSVGQPNETGAVTVDAVTHRLYVGVSGRIVPSFVDVFGPSLLVPDVTTGEASGVGVESATFNGTVDPDEAGPATCQFKWGPTPSLGQTAPCSAPVANGGEPVAVHAEVTGIAPDSTYYYRLQATNANGTNSGETSQPGQVTTLGAGIHDTSASDVTSSSATLDAKIDPNGSPTTIHFQFGTSTAYGGVAPEPPGRTIGSGKGDVEVGVHVQQGISPGTTYHYRVVAVSQIEVSPGVTETREFTGPDETFTTQGVTGGVLPDGRQWEMVSPPDKQGTQILAIGQYSKEGAVIEAAAGGGAITYMTAAPTEVNPTGYANYQQVFSARGASGWASRDISPAHETAAGIAVGYGEEYRFFSEDLSLGMDQPFGALTRSLSNEASEQTPFVHTDFVNGDATDPCVDACYRPVVSGAPGHADVPSGAKFGDDTACSGTTVVICGPVFVGATPDLGHVLLTSKVALTSTPIPGGEDGAKWSLYEWSGGNLKFVSVLPDGEAAANEPSPGSPAEGAGGLGGVLGGANSRRAISKDGSRIVWSAENHLYLRDMNLGESGKTLQLDVVQGGSGDGQASPLYQVASVDASRVFFTDGQHLTTDAGGNAVEPDLYECEIVAVTGGLECRLSDLTPSVGGAPANVGGVVGASEDGSSVYYVAGTTLYLRHNGLIRTVAVLSSADVRDWSPPLDSMTSRVSSDGRWVAFMSQRELTGNNTHDAVTGEPDEEVYLYDAEANGGAGRLVCASCNPTGARPIGVEGQTDNVADVGSWSSLVAASVPGWTPFWLDGSLYQSRYLSDGGRLFFNSSDGLVPQDVNGEEDVYEFEPPGVGGCSTGSVLFSARSGGCVGLISSGGSGEESGFMDANATGNDVFFLTTSKLSSADRDSAIDLYDARECTTDSPCFAQPAAVPPPCDTGDSCKAAPVPQPGIFGASSSATFSGVGNVTSPGVKAGVKSKSLTRAQKLARALKACGKKTRRQRAVCRRRAKARYAVRRSTRAGTIVKGGR